MEFAIITAFITLLLMEIVLGIDNLVFVSLLSGKLPQHEQGRARRIGIIGASVIRIGLLFVAGLLVHLTDELFSVFGRGFSVKDLVMLVGGLFLIGKATHEIHERLEGDSDHSLSVARVAPKLGAVVAQIILLDFVFSIDSVITAVGLTEHLPVMISAVVSSVIVMLLASGYVARFIERHPTVKVLALGFLTLIGTMLVAEGLGQHIPKGYIYFAMGFSVFVEGLNIACKKKASV